MKSWRLRVKAELLKKQARDEREYSVAEIAAAIGRSESTVRLYLADEIENPTMSTLALFAQYLDCRIKDLYVEQEGDDRGEAGRPYPEAELTPSRAVA